MAEPRVADVVLHPVRLRIVHELAGRELTTAQLREALPDVTQATLYRHVATLVRSGIVTVVSERKVRGATERTLALGERAAHVDRAELRTLSDARLREAFVTFLAEVGGAFDRALADDDPAVREHLGFARGPLYVDTDDLAAIQEGLGRLLAPYRDDRDGARRVDLVTMLIPDAGPAAAD